LEKPLLQGDVQFHSHIMVRLYASWVAPSEWLNIAKKYRDGKKKNANVF